ncbi:hypothetical protein [Streptomyces sp. NPDC059787]|uniref:hypothetical protein n=1 Tax=Streptomyces sp. NPDC059787 TaxID=3346947 RepID=UPI0036511F0B
MSDTSHQSAVRIYLDRTFGPYDAWIDRSAAWNSLLFPVFDLETVRKIAADTQRMAEEDGHDSTITLHVLDGGTRDGKPRAVVLSVFWAALSDDPEDNRYAIQVIQPNARGRYSIGSGEWPWTENGPADNGDRP